jgi:RND family efflux transporter MFP subunit
MKRMKRMKNMKQMAVLLLSWSLLTVACGFTEPPAADRPPAEPLDVVVAPAATRALSRSFEAGGVVRARTTAAIVSRIVAEVREVRVEPGDQVRRGQLLVVLDDRDLVAGRERAEAAVRAADQGAEAAAADRDAAESAQALARVTHERVRTLREKNSATPQELDQALAGLDAAEARLRGAEARVAESAAGVDAARAARESAAVTASYAVLEAPFAGTIAEKRIEPGNLAAAGMPLLMLEDTRAFQLEVSIDESRLQAAALGRIVEVELDDPDGTTDRTTSVAGRVAELSRALDAGAHSVQVKIDVPPNPDLRSGMFARARFTEPVRSGLAISADSIVRRGQLTIVFVVDVDSRARIRPVRLGPATPDGVEVLAGLVAGEQVVVSPPAALTDGGPVRSSSAPAEAPAGARP